MGVCALNCEKENRHGRLPPPPSSTTKECKLFSIFIKSCRPFLDREYTIKIVQDFFDMQYHLQHRKIVMYPHAFKRSDL